MLVDKIILVICTFAAFYSGFYFGYLKREDKPPEMPLNITQIKADIQEARKEKEEPTGFYD